MVTILDADGQLLRFNENSRTLGSGTENTVGAVYKYSNAIAIDGTQVDSHFSHLPHFPDSPTP